MKKLIVALFAFWNLLMPAGFANDQTISFGDLQMDQEQIKKVAENIFRVVKSMTEEHPVSDGLTLTAYILRYMAEIGEYELVQKDMMTLVRSFEQMRGQKVDDVVDAALAQVRKLQFGTRKGKLWVKAFAHDKKRGIVVPINSPGEAGSDVQEIVEAVIKDGAELSFIDADKEVERRLIATFVKEKVRLLGVFASIVESLNQIHPALQSSIDAYLASPDKPVAPMRMEFKDVEVLVKTSTMFNDIKFKFYEGVTLPGIRMDGEAVPSFVLGAKSGLLKLKVSIDQ
jgi:hypothetical protein